MIDVSKIKECPDCSSTNIKLSKAREQVSCKDCGLIFQPLEPELEEKFERAKGWTETGKGKTQVRKSRKKKASVKPVRKASRKKKK